jgi:hypothetical protein
VRVCTRHAAVGGILRTLARGVCRQRLVGTGGISRPRQSAEHRRSEGPPAKKDENCVFNSEWEELECCGVAGPYPDFGFYYIQNPVPETLSAANADAAADLSYVQTDFSTAVTDFGSGDYADGATAAFQLIGNLVTAPEVEALGLVDALNIGTL